MASAASLSEHLQGPQGLGGLEAVRNRLEGGHFGLERRGRGRELRSARQVAIRGLREDKRNSINCETRPLCLCLKGMGNSRLTSESVLPSPVARTPVASRFRASRAVVPWERRKDAQRCCRMRAALLRRYMTALHFA